MPVHTNDEYDIGKAFAAIEDELMASMIRNMNRHKVEEVAEDKQWSMWQAGQLKSLERYKRENQKKYGQQFKDINNQITELIRMARDEGEMDQEIAILRAIQKGFPAERSARGATAEFFKLNERKLEALIKATTDDMQKAETAVFRMANDRYRKVIFNAQVYATTGVGTYEKAVDMATRDFIAVGLNCVEYKNGARHTLSDYADMAIRTAAKRAYLQGEGTKRAEWGISTVIMNKRGNPCPKCLPFCGKVLIDDVWSGGSRADGKYPLMSYAIEQGLYHPRCKDHHTTYFPGISTADDTWTEEELKNIGVQAKEEAKQQHAKRQMERFGRLARFSLDEENKAKYGKKYEEWKQVLENTTQSSTIEPKFLFKNYKPGINTVNERIVAIDAISSVPRKVQESIQSGTTVILGRKDYSAYDYEKDVLYVSKGAEKEDVVHEIGHLVESKMLNDDAVKALRKKIIGDVSIYDIKQDVFYDKAGNPYNIFYIENDKFVSEYQGRIYVRDPLYAFNENGEFNDDLLWEFIAESFREYIMNPEVLKDKSKELYEFIKGAIE